MIAVLGLNDLHAQTSTINADKFYNKAIKLQKLGVRAPFNSDFKSLITQAKRSYRINETRNKNAKKRGNPLYCRKEDQNMSPRKVLSEMRKIPKIRRQKINLTQAFLIIAKRNYPC